MNSKVYESGEKVIYINLFVVFFYTAYNAGFSLFFFYIQCNFLQLIQSGPLNV